MILIKEGLLFINRCLTEFIGDLLISDGKIIKIDKNIDITSYDNQAEITLIDARGLWVMPGLIEAHCHVGISSDKKTDSSNDANEITSPITPYLRAIDAINTLDPAFHNAIASGITTIMTGPGSSNVVGGQFVLLKTHGLTRNIDSMIVKSPSAMKVAFGENPKKAFLDLKVAPMTRMATAFLLREELWKAKNYLDMKENSKNHTDKNSTFQSDIRLESWIPVLKKEIPLKAHCHRADDILTAIRIGKEYDINVTLDHCSEGHLIADDILDSSYPAIVGPSMVSRNKEEAINIDFKTVGILNKKGVLVAITTDHPVIQIQYLSICAGLAAKYGLGIKEALKAITINPAIICGVENQIGSLEPGKDADIAIFSANPLETFSETMYTIIDGIIVYNRMECFKS